MTIRNYISQKFASIGLRLTDADLLDMNIEDADAEVTEQEIFYKKFIAFIPQLLLRPESISEGGTSLRRASRDDLINFYSSECKRLGLKNELEKPRPKVIFR